MPMTHILIKVHLLYIYRNVKFKRERDDHISFEIDVIGYSSEIDVKEIETRRKSLKKI